MRNARCRAHRGERWRGGGCRGREPYSLPHVTAETRRTQRATESPRGRPLTAMPSDVRLDPLHSTRGISASAHLRGPLCVLRASVVEQHITTATSCADSVSRDDTEPACDLLECSRSAPGEPNRARSCVSPAASKDAGMDHASAGWGRSLPPGALPLRIANRPAQWLGETSRLAKSRDSALLVSRSDATRQRADAPCASALGSRRPSGPASRGSTVAVLGRFASSVRAFSAAFLP